MSAWKKVALRDVTQTVSTWNPTTKASEEFFDYVDLSAIDQDRKAISGARNIPCHEAPSRARQLVAADDVLVSTVRPNLNGVASVPSELDGATASTGFCILRAEQKSLEPAFLFHWVKSPLFVADMVRKATGASYPAVSDRIVLESSLSLPPLPEQRRIAEVLDRAEALRTKRRAALAKLDSLTQSIFLDMFGDPVSNPMRWPIGRIGDLLSSASYGTNKKAGAVGEFPVLRMGNITSSGEIDLGSLKYMDLASPEYDRYLARDGDILFNRTNSAELVGKSAVFRNPKPMAYAGYLVRLRMNADSDPEYLGRFLNTNYAKVTLRGMAKSIVGMANINAKEIQAMKIAMPPIALQRAFALRIASVEKLKSSHRAALTELDALFASLQHRAFRGEL